MANKLLDILLAKTGRSAADTPSTSKLGKLFRKQGIPETSELQRILNLPRRQWQDGITGSPEEMAILLSNALRRPGGTRVLRPIQAAALTELHDFGGLFGLIPVGLGKCLSGNTEVFDGHCRRTVEELVGKEFDIVTKYEDGKLGYERATAVLSGRKRCVELRLADGSKSILSKDHPVFTGRGWIQAGELLDSDLVAVARSIPTPTSVTDISDDEVVLAAYLLSDGGVSQDVTMFTNATASVCEEFIAVANRLSDPSQNLNSTRKEAGCVDRPSKSKARQICARGLSWFRRKWDINGLAKEKRLPASFWGLSEAQCRLFLNRFWACDGYVNPAGFGVCLASEKMINDLKFLLLRLGVKSRKAYKPSKCNGKVFDAWRLEVTGQDGCRFLESVGDILGKEAACERFRSKTFSRRNTNVDVVPVSVQECHTISDEMGWPRRSGYRAPNAPRCRSLFQRFLGVTKGQWLGRDKFALGCKAFGYTGRLAWLADSDLMWVKISKISNVGFRPVYDVSVPATGCFVGDNIVLHNTDVSLLAPKVLGSKRPLLLIPAKLRAKTKRDYDKLQVDWILPQIRIESYELLSRVQGKDILISYRPDLIICDEAHRCKHSTAAVTRRLKSYMNENPSTRFVALSGTMTRNSLHEYWHIIRWCLGERGMPLPSDWEELSQWADCLDVGSGAHRMAPGALELLCNEEEKKDLDLGMEAALTSVRKAYRRRLTETPGVIAMGETQLACSLAIDELRVDLNHLAPYFKHLRKKWRTPDGHPFEEPVDLWRHARELTCGFFFAWWDQKRFVQGVKEALAAGADLWTPSEVRLLNAISRWTELDLSLNRAVTKLTAASSEDENEITTDLATGALTTKPLAPSPPPEQVEEVLNWLVETKPDSSRVELAAGRLIAWETVLRGCPMLLPALLSAIEMARPPQKWLGTRQLWSKFVRMQLSKTRSKLDTELQVIMAVMKCECGRWRKDHEGGIGAAPETKTRLSCERFCASDRGAADGLADGEGKCRDCDYDRESHINPVYAILPACKRFRPQLEQSFHDEELDETYENVWDNWVAMRDTYKPVVETVWIDDTVLKAAAEWLKEHRGIAWVEHPSVGKRLSEIAGVPYYGEGGKGKQYKPGGIATPVGLIEDEQKSCVASIKANAEGRNLQIYFSEGLILSCPPNGAILEQLLGRKHRTGQTADEVRYTMILACKEQLFGFYRAMKDARYIQETTGNSQKLLYADVTVMSADEAMQLQGPLWK